MRIRDTHRFRRHPSLLLVPTHFSSSSLSLSTSSGNKTNSNPFNGGGKEHIIGAGGIGVALFWCATSTSAECERSSDEKALDDDADDNEWFLLKRAKEFVSQLTGGANTLGGVSLVSDEYRREVFFAYENRLREHSNLDKVFAYFASGKTREETMTKEDLIRSAIMYKKANIRWEFRRRSGLGRRG